MKKVMMLLILGMFLLSFAPMISADNIGNFKLNKSFQITNYCGTGDCSYMNITSITDPDGQVTYLNVEMTKTGQEFNYTYNPGKLGVYNFKTCADPENTFRCESDTFTVSKSGEELTTQLSIAYIGLIFFLFCVFILSLVGTFRIKNFIGVFIMFWVTFLLFFAITFICYQVTDSYFINVEFLGTFFWILYWIMLIGTIPLFFSSMVYLFYIITYNDHFRKLVEKGMSPEEAFKFNDKKLNPFKSGGRR